MTGEEVFSWNQDVYDDRARRAMIRCFLAAIHAVRNGV